MLGEVTKLSHLVEQCAHHVASLLPSPFFLITLAPRGLFLEDILARFFLFLSANGENLWSLRL
ncbi:hypothetical protein NM74_22545 [Aeromonas hydrophila]|nr:hypothetical protein NM74_22545 [Aeromonas hydrophila]